MSILNKLSDVIKEVFWIKTKPKRKTAVRSKAAATKKKIRKIVKKVKAIKEARSKTSLKTKPKTSLPPKPALRQAKTVTPQVEPVKAVKTPKQPAAVKVLKVKKPEIDPQLVQVGEITHFFERINVCVVKISQGTILIGDRLTVIGPKTKLVQKVWSMQIESQDVKVAKKGQVIGLKVDKPVVVGDVVYK